MARRSSTSSCHRHPMLRQRGRHLQAAPEPPDCVVIATGSRSGHSASSYRTTAAVHQCDSCSGCSNSGSPAVFGIASAESYGSKQTGAAEAVLICPTRKQRNPRCVQKPWAGPRPLNPGLPPPPAFARLCVQCRSAMAPAVTDADNNNNDGEAVVVDAAINKVEAETASLMSFWRRTLLVDP
ncbi:hypothetical protein DFJ73DRAFT_963929 [Zopfochytrium polystomum]|nr:hypothetical protein DFJ73DRAFT_963929 [Zopfochytrium polystomum]